MRQFETGATRDDDQNKFDYEGFLSPTVVERFGEYMHSHRKQADGKLRDSDNWQKGIPIPAYMKSMWRHFFEVWRDYRKGSYNEEAACALMFNVMGFMHEILKTKESVRPAFIPAFSVLPVGSNSGGASNPVQQTITDVRQSPVVQGVPKPATQAANDDYWEQFRIKADEWAKINPPVRQPYNWQQDPNIILTKADDNFPF